MPDDTKGRAGRAGRALTRTYNGVVIVFPVAPPPFCMSGRSEQASHIRDVTGPLMSGAPAVPSKSEHLTPDQSAGYQVRRCHRRLDRLLHYYLGKHDLKSGYWYYLRVLWMNDEVSQKCLSDMANVAENTTAVLTLSATDADLPSQTVTFSIGW